MTGLQTKDIEITKEDGVVIVHAAWDDKVSYLGDVSLVVSFDKTVRIE